MPVTITTTPQERAELLAKTLRSLGLYVAHAEVTREPAVFSHEGLGRTTSLYGGPARTTARLEIEATGQEGTELLYHLMVSGTWHGGFSVRG